MEKFFGGAQILQPLSLRWRRNDKVEQLFPVRLNRSLLNWFMRNQVVFRDLIKSASMLLLGGGDSG
ncbi:hypothetical protein YC2023_069344 [Brassica napus]